MVIRQEIESLTNAMNNLIKKIERNNGFENNSDMVSFISWLEGQIFNKIVAAYDVANANIEEILKVCRETITDFPKYIAGAVKYADEITNVMKALYRIESKIIEKNVASKIRDYGRD